MKKACCIILCMILCLTGCGRIEKTEESQSVMESNNMPPVTTENDNNDSNEQDGYRMEICDTGIIPEYQPYLGSIVMSEDRIYYVDKTEGQANRIGVVSMEEPEKGVKILLQLEDARIEAMTPAKNNSGEDIIILSGKDIEGAPFLASYTMEGELLWEQPFGNPQMLILKVVQDSNGCYYAMCTKQILFFNQEGIYQESIDCPKWEYIDLCISEAGKVFASYYDEDIYVYLATLENQNFSKEMRVPEIGDFSYGQLGTGKENTILFIHSDKISSYDPERQEFTDLLELEDYYLKQYQIQSFRENSFGELNLISWEPLSMTYPVNLVRFKSALEEQLENTEKQRVTFLTIGDSGGRYDDAVVYFNQQSKEYEVVIEEISLSGIASWSNMYERINTRLLASDGADLIEFWDYRDMSRYLAKGYLEDLAPYIAQSENINIEEYLEPVVQCFTRGEAVYSIPYIFSVDTLVGRTSELGDESGWTVQEFLDWISEHPDAVARDGLSKEAILQFCLMGNLNEYLDWETGTCYFEEDNFTDLLMRIYDLHTDSAQHWDDWQQQINENKAVLNEDMINDFNCFFREENYGGSIVYKGFPNNEGKPCHFYYCGGLSILSQGKCKEGAYAFWEYYLTRNKKIPDSAFYTRKEMFNDSLTYIKETQFAYGEDGGLIIYSPTFGIPGEKDANTEWLQISEEELDNQLNMINHAQMDTLDNQIIRSIIQEEASYYFAGVKNLEDTCRVIQSRVQLYLAEIQK